MPDTNQPRIEARPPAPEPGTPKPGTHRGATLLPGAMPPNPPPTQAPARPDRPKRRWITWLIALAALLAAAGVAANGILQRQDAYHQQSAWTDKQAVLTVEVLSPTTEAAARTITIPGDIEAFYQAPIYARVNGYVKMWFKDIGDRVHAGDVLATIDTPELDQQMGQVKADLLTAQTTQKLAETTAKRWQALVSSNSVSVQSTDEKVADAATKAALTKAAEANVQRVQAMLDFKQLTAPFAGVVTARRTDIGALISAGSAASDRELFMVADLHRMRIYVRVPQVYSAMITAGMKATLQLPQYPDKPFTAQVITTANAIDPVSRTVLVQLQADNPKGELWPGTYAQVVFQLPANPNALMIPASALIFQEHGAQVATVDATNHVRLKDVRVGKDEGTRLEVLDGLNLQDRIIDSPPDTLSEGETVHLAKDSRTTQPDGTHPEPQPSQH